GVSVTLDAAQDGIQLPMANSKFKNFKQEDYDKLYAQLKGGKLEIKNDTAAADAAELPVENVVVESIK
ncbi:MAG: BMP family ABC transporter substrate-binding protein, partial [Lachnospiraceae bacterium]|nr:BMP family ABC transporter substrate-binding protein [Lachnospiraceae bacterium]